MPSLAFVSPSGAPNALRVIDAVYGSLRSAIGLFVPAYVALHAETVYSSIVNTVDVLAGELQ